MASTFVLNLEPMLLPGCERRYADVLTLSAFPAGPLADRVRAFAPLKINGNRPMSRPRCAHVLTRSEEGRCSSFALAEDLPPLLGYLLGNGYTVDTRLTKLLPAGRGRRVVALVTFSP